MPAQRPQKAERKDVRCGGKAARAYKENEMRVISGTARGTRLAALPGEEITRPTVDRVKEGMFSAVQFLLAGARVLDLFAGSGQLGIEALSRGAKHAVFVDAASKAVEAVRANLKHCKLSDQAKIAQMDAASFLKSTTTRFDIVFLDPPYQQKIIDAVLPMVVGQMAPQGIILCETERNEQLPESAGDYEIAKTYFYGKAKITAYRRKEGQEEE